MVNSFDILTSYLNHLSPLQGYFFTFSIWARINFNVKAPYSISSIKIQIFQIEVLEDLIS